MIPLAGQVELQRLTALDLQRACSAWLGRGLSPRTVTQHHRVLRRALEDAVAWGLLPGNPAAKAKPPRWEAPEMRALDKAEVAALLEAVRGTTIEPLVVLALATGMRRGEILGLRWRGVDLQRGAVTVAQAVQRVGGRLVAVPPKTRGSVRRVRIGPEALAALRRQRLWCQERRLAWGPAWRAEAWDLVFPREDGQPRSPNWLSSMFRRAARRAGLRPPLPRFHDLRYTFTTLQAAAGTPIHVISQMLGHSDVTTTLRIYAHVLPVQQESAAEVADRLLAGARSNPSPGRRSGRE
ncbi:MAG: site-specific integrase [Chloroflexi bacterium]|nr:site-specific integrase [Chloroflexota bacterium]